MPTINDTPTVIYVRDMTEQETQDFMKIKKKFNLNSNNEVVKTLFKKFLELDKELQETKIIAKELLHRNRKNESDLTLIQEAFLCIKNFKKSEK